MTIRKHGFKIELFFIHEEGEQLTEICIVTSTNTKKTDKRIKRFIPTSPRSVSSQSQSHSSGNDEDESSSISGKIKAQKRTRRFIHKVEVEDPGISKDGWLSMWMNKEGPGQVKVPIHSSQKTAWSEADDDDSCSRKLEKTSSFTLSSSIDEQNEINLIAESIHIASFEVNVLSFEDNLRRYALPLKVFRKREYLAQYKISGPQFLVFLKRLESEYNVHQNPFHNFVHGLNVMYSSHLLAESFAKHLDSQSMFAVILSALCHDVGHTGRTNAFEINSGSELAMLYNDRSPL